LRINQDLCVGCGKCTAYCTMGVISVQDHKAYIDEDECVECGVCLKLNVCPVRAIYQDELQEPRVIRSQFSNPEVPHKRTKRHGRGTEEMKTNDVTNRFNEGEIGLCIEVGRPGIGTRLRDVEKICMALAQAGIILEEHNPIYDHIKDLKLGKLRDEVLGEKVMSAIVEVKEEPRKIVQALERVKELSAILDTVISVSVICRVREDGEIPDYDLLKELGYVTNGHAKVNVGLGRISSGKGGPLK
jgi:NAD-dependent dihydropyrimidine dehydrogenase PreA subunit